MTTDGDAAREQARRADGAFGDQVKDEPTLRLDTTDPFMAGTRGSIGDHVRWWNYCTPRGASFNPWRGEMAVLLPQNLSDVGEDEEDAAVDFMRAAGEHLLETPFAAHDPWFADAASALAGAEDVDEVNDALGELYDWADGRRIILTFKKR